MTGAMEGGQSAESESNPSSLERKTTKDLDPFAEVLLQNVYNRDFIFALKMASEFRPTRVVLNELSGEMTVEFLGLDQH